MYAFHHAELIEIRPERFVVHHVQGAAAAVAPLLRDLPAVVPALIAAHQDRVDHIVRACQAGLAAGGLCGMQAAAKLLRQPCAERIGRVQTLFVNIHQADLAAVQRFCQAQIPHEVQREDPASRAKHTNFDRHFVTSII